MEKQREPLSHHFARVYGTPGEAPRVMGLLRAFWPLLLICLAIGYLLRALLPTPKLEASHVGMLFFLVAASAGMILVWGNRRLGNFLKGAQGEEWVAHELAFLSPEYAVFNGLRLRGGKQNFDHIVVAPAGIFVVETKNWKGSVEFRDGKLYAGGKEPSRPPLRQVKAATLELVTFLDEANLRDVPVHSVLCFISTQLPEDLMNVNGVVVCTGARLNDVLQEEAFDRPIAEELRRRIEDALCGVMNGD